MDADKMPWEKPSQELHKNATIYIEQILKVTPHEITAVRSLTSHH